MDCNTETQQAFSWKIGLEFSEFMINFQGENIAHLDVYAISRINQEFAMFKWTAQMYKFVLERIRIASLRNGSTEYLS